MVGSYINADIRNHHEEKGIIKAKLCIKAKV